MSALPLSARHAPYATRRTGRLPVTDTQSHQYEKCQRGRRFRSPEPPGRANEGKAGKAPGYDLLVVGTGPVPGAKNAP
ncbi:hypothetical protein GCM10010360_58750 [Streptomyces nogalater]